MTATQQNAPPHGGQTSRGGAFPFAQRCNICLRDCNIR
nr:MAG TPA: hypothetical protein [Caudoviricetes sp.]